MARVLYVITGLGTGGAERALHSLLLAADGKGTYECEVISLTDGGVYADRIRELGVPIHSLGMGRGLGLVGALRRLRRSVRRMQPDIVHSWMYHACLVALPVYDLHVPIVWGVRQSLQETGRQKRMTQLVIRAAAVLSRLPKAIVYNSTVSQRQHEAIGFSGRRSAIIPNGFDLERWRPSEEDCQKTRAALGIPETALVVGHFARFHPMKDHASYLQALVAVADRHPRAHFVLAGTQAELGNQELAPLFAALPSERLHVLGERHDIEQLMPALDVVCLSSAWGEAFPNVLGEAMACGVPCVSTDVGDSREIVGDTGIIVPPGDAVALSNALDELLKKQPQERERLGVAARKRVQSNYSMGSVADLYFNLYAEVSRNRQIR